MLYGDTPRCFSMGSCRVDGVKGCCQRPLPPAAPVRTLLPSLCSILPGGPAQLRDVVPLFPFAGSTSSKARRELGGGLVRRQTPQISQTLVFLLVHVSSGLQSPEFLGGHHQLVTGDLWPLLLSALTHFHRNSPCLRNL